MEDAPIDVEWDCASAVERYQTALEAIEKLLTLPPPDHHIEVRDLLVRTEQARSMATQALNPLPRTDDGTNTTKAL